MGTRKGDGDAGRGRGVETGMWADVEGGRDVEGGQRIGGGTRKGDGWGRRTGGRR